MDAENQVGRHKESVRRVLQEYPCKQHKTKSRITVMSCYLAGIYSKDYSKSSLICGPFLATKAFGLLAGGFSALKKANQGQNSDL